MSAAALVDLEAFDVLKEVMEDEFKDLVQLYITDSEKRFSDLDQALDNHDVEQIKQLAHSFKGASANLAATDLAELCFNLERMGTENKLAGSQELLQLIHLEYDRVKAYLLTHI